MARFERDLFPWIGAHPVADVTAPQLLAVIQRIEKRGALETAHRALGNCGQVFRYAIQTGRAERDPSSDLRGALPPVKGKHFAAVTEPKRVGELLRMMEGYEGTLTVRCALRLAQLVFVRPGELRTALWADIDLDAAEWRYTVSKTNTPHIVPLSRQAVAILRELQPLTRGSRYVLHSARSIDRPMSDNAILAAMRRLGIGKDEMSGHGFRAMARTILDEVLGVRPDLIEHQLAHAVKDSNGRAYNRTAHMPERSGTANLNSVISGNSGSKAGTKMFWQEGVSDGKEESESIGAAHAPHPQRSVQGAGCLGGAAGRQDAGRTERAV